MKPLAVSLVAVAALAANPAMVVVNGRIWTGVASAPWAEALAVSGSEISAVGSSRDILALAGPSTEVIDAGGSMVTPGFIDSHIHLHVFDAVRHPPLFLRFLKGRQAVADRVQALAGTLPEGSWIRGQEWIPSTWGNTPPSLAWLDRIAPAHPLWLAAASGEAGYANSVALRLAGIRSAEGSGLVQGGVLWKIDDAMMASTRVRDQIRIERVMDQLAAAGVTSVHHNNSWHQLILLRAMHRAGRLKVRVYAAPGFPGVRRLREFIDEYGCGDEWLHWGGLKGYGAITAAKYYPWISAAARAGIQSMVHTGSEAELRTLLDVFEQVRSEQRLKDPRFRIEHAHDVPAGSIPRIARAGAMMSWQPPLLAHVDQRTASGSLPPKNLFDCLGLLENGIRIAFGSDAVPESVYTPPLEGLRMALERAGPDGRRLSLDDALRAYTRDAAWAEFAEGRKGTLEPGKLADFVILDADLSHLPANRFRDVRVRLTAAGGRITWRQPAFSPVPLK